jgi:hypothetical protein
VDVLAADLDFAFDPHVIDEVVHAVEAAEQGGFSAAAGPDEGGDHALTDGHGDVLQRLGRAVEKAQILGDDEEVFSVGSSTGVAGTMVLKFRLAVPVSDIGV